MTDAFQLYSIDGKPQSELHGNDAFPLVEAVNGLLARKGRERNSFGLACDFLSQFFLCENPFEEQNLSNALFTPGMTEGLIELLLRHSPGIYEALAQAILFEVASGKNDEPTVEEQRSLCTSGDHLKVPAQFELTNVLQDL